MIKLTSSSYFKSFVITLVVLSFAFLGALAIADPVCTHCTMAIAYKAMLGAKYLASAWIFAGMLYSWDYRSILSNKLKTRLSSLRLRILTTKKVNF